MLSLHIYLMLAEEEDPEAPNPTKFATVAICWGQLILIMSINLLATRINSKRHEILYLMNQLITYHYYITNFRKSKGITLSREDRRTVRVAEVQVNFISTISFIFPFFIMAALFHPIEPIHVMVRDWLDFDIKFANLTYGHLVFVPFFLASLLLAGNTALQFTFMSSCYYALCVSTLRDLMPTGLDQMKDSRRCTLQTETYGVMEDSEVIQMWRKVT